MFLRRLSLIVLLSFSLSSCGINTVPTAEEEAKGRWADVENAYQRRADLIPNLVETVKGFAAQEREVLTEVTEARARATQVHIDAGDLSDPQAMQRYQEAQSGLTNALSKLNFVVERYPELRSNENFLMLQSQLEGTENRVAVARRDYIEQVRDYNREFAVIPDRWVAAVFNGAYEPAEVFEAPEAAQEAPEVRFGDE